MVFEEVNGSLEVAIENGYTNVKSNFQNYRNNGDKSKRIRFQWIGMRENFGNDLIGENRINLSFSISGCLNKGEGQGKNPTYSFNTDVFKCNEGRPQIWR